MARLSLGEKKRKRGRCEKKKNLLSHLKKKNHFFSLSLEYRSHPLYLSRRNSSRLQWRPLLSMHRRPPRAGAASG